MTDRKTDKALLVVSFGTTHEETRAVTIDAIEEDLAAAFPGRRLYRGWTSGMILRILKKRTGTTFDSVEEALERMAADGITDVLVQPTHIIPGEENDRMREMITGFSDRFERIAIGRPLLSSQEDLQRLALILAEELLGAKGCEETSGRTLILMGHGSADKPEANQVYRDLEQTFRSCGYDNVFVATVEGTHTLEDTLKKLEDAAAKMERPSGSSNRIAVLTPLMTVAGDHAKNDMAGDDENSWKNRLEEAGFSVCPVLRGLGEYPAVRELFILHAKQGQSLSPQKQDARE